MKDEFCATAKCMADAIRGECFQALDEVTIHFPKLSENDIAHIAALTVGIYYFDLTENNRSNDIRFVCFALAEAFSLGLCPVCDKQTKQLFNENKAFMRTFIKKYDGQWS